MPTNYQRGRAFEYRVRDKLKKMGAAYVMRAAQSKGIVDLLAVWPRRDDRYGDDCPHRPNWLVQAKYSIKGGGFLSAMEAEILKDLAEQTAAVPVFAKPGKNGRGVEFINLFTKEQIG